MHKSKPFNTTLEGWTMASLIAWFYHVPLWLAIVCTILAIFTVLSWVIDKCLDKMERKFGE